VQLASLVRITNMAFVLNRLPQARMRDVIVIALAAEGIPATLHATVETDRRSAVTALRHGSLAAWHSYVAVTGYIRFGKVDS